MARRRIALGLAAVLAGLALLGVAWFARTEGPSTAGEGATRDPVPAERPAAAPVAAPSPIAPATGALDSAALRPAAPGGIRGRVVFQGCTLLGAVLVHCIPIPADEEAAAVTSEELAKRGIERGNDDAWVHAENGFGYEYAGLRPGRYLLWVAMPAGGPVLHREEVEVAAEPVTRDLRVAVHDPEGFVGVRVLGPEGTVPPDLFFRAGCAFARGGSVEGTSMALARNDGLLLVPHYEMESRWGEAVTWWVEAHSATLGSRRAAYRKGQEEEVVLRFEEPGALDVTLTGVLDPSPGRDGLRIVLRPAGAGEDLPGFPSGGLDGDGRAAIAAVQPGDYDALLVAGMSQALARVPVTVRSGSNELSFPAPALHAVTVIGAEPGSHVTVFRRGPLPWNDRCPADAEGRAVFEGIPEGDFTVRCGSKSRQFRVPDAVEVRL